MPATTFISHQSRSVGYYLWPHRIPLTVWQNRQLIRQMVGRAVASRYRGSVLGLLWSFLLPLIMLAVYTFVFSVVFRARWGGDGQESKVGFALTLFCGLLLYNVFAECAGGSAGVIQLHANFVKKVVFPLEILPVVTLGAALFNALVSVVILLLGVAVFQQPVVAPPFVVGMPGMKVRCDDDALSAKPRRQITEDVVRIGDGVEVDDVRGSHFREDPPVHLDGMGSVEVDLQPTVQHDLEQRVVDAVNRERARVPPHQHAAIPVEPPEPD